MKKVMCLVAMLSLVATASASVDIFITSAAEFDAMPNETFTTDEIDFLGDFAGVGGTPIAEPVNLGVCGEAPPQTFYVWGQFNGEAAYTQIYGMHFYVETDGCMQLLNSAHYRHNKTSGPPGQRWDRWDGDQPVTFGPDSGILAAVTADGIMDSFMDYDLGDGQTFLMGAIELGCPEPGDGGTANLVFGDLGLIAYDGNTGESIRPDVSINGVMAPANPPEGPFGVEIAYCEIPEPASLLLIGLAGLMLRRR